MNLENYYYSKYTNIIDLKDNDNLSFIYNSLSGNIALGGKKICKKMAGQERLEGEESDRLLKNRFIYRDENEEKVLLEKLIKISGDISTGKLKLHVFLDKENIGKTTNGDFFQELKKEIMANCEKKIALYFYLYESIEKTFYTDLDRFICEENLKDRLTLVFVIDPLNVHHEDILPVKSIENKSVIVMVDPAFFPEGDDFPAYLEKVFLRIKEYPNLRIPLAVIFNLKKSYLNLMNIYYSFFMKKGDIRYSINIALNPVIEIFQIKKDLGLFCYPDYDLYGELLDIVCSSPKYNLVKVVGYGLIPKIQQFLVERKYLKPTIDFCEWRSQKIYTPGTGAWIDCFKAINGDATKNDMPLKSGCTKCPHQFLCCGMCPLTEAPVCPSIDKFFNSLSSKLLPVGQ